MATKRKVVKVPKWAEGLTRVQRRRVEVCRDVLARIAAKKIVVEQGTYLRGWGFHAREILDGRKSVELQSVLPQFEKKETCRVCAKGALFVSAVDKFDACELTVDAFGEAMVNGRFMESEKGLMKTLVGVFTKEQLDLVEEAFEASWEALEEANEALADKNVRYKVWTAHSTKLRDAIRALKFGLKYASPTKRLGGIMHNMIKNKGVFKP